MSKRTPIIAGLLLVLAAVIAWRVVSQLEPACLGQPISYWIEPWHHHGTEPPEREAAAFAEMDERAVRWLARQLEWKPSRLKEGCARFLNRFGDFTTDRDYDGGRRFAALRALTQLGPRAKAAIPELEALSHTNVELNRDPIRVEAAAALVRIRGDSLQPYLEKLPNAAGEEWAGLATILGTQETNAAAAAPILVAGLMQTNRIVWVQPTVLALGRIHSHPELSVPALIQQLGKTNPVAEYQVFTALARFGAEARSAWPDLAARWAATTNYYDRQALRNALQGIDPERFAKTNWP
jgi:hypothetical protein